MINVRARIESVMQLRCPKRVKKTTYKNGVPYKVEVNQPWVYLTHRENADVIEYAYHVPSGYSCHDLRQETDALYAAIGSPVKIIDRGGVVVVHISKQEFPKIINFTPDMLWSLGGREVLCGYTISAQPVIHNFRVPHVLIGGQSGYGKTDLLRLWLLSIIAKHSPEQVWIDIVDGKGFSFLPFRGIPHIRRIVRDLAGASTVISDAKKVMMQRSEKVWASGDRDLSANFQWRIVLIDELAVISPSMQSTKESKELAAITYANMCSVACVGREAGVGMIMATQRPDANVVHPQVKQNCDVSIALRCKTQTNSEIILDHAGAEMLPHGVPGRAIYGADEDTIFQIPYVGKDDRWFELLSPYRKEEENDGESDSGEATDDYRIDD